MWSLCRSAACSNKTNQTLRIKTLRIRHWGVFVTIKRIRQRQSAVALAATLCVGGLGGAAQAQDGGVQLTFGLSESLTSNSNQALDVKSAGSTTSATTLLSFGLVSETATQRLSLDMSANLRLANTPATKGTVTRVGDPAVTLAYSVDGASAGLQTKAYYRKADVAFLRPLTDFVDPLGNINLPTDLADLTGTGTRAEYGANLTYDWGRDGPLGVSLSAGLAGLTYDNTTSPALFDNRRITLAATAGYQINPATRATTTLRFARFAASDAFQTRSNTSGLDLGLTRTMDRGTASATLSADRSDAGTRLGFRLGRALDLPGGALSASLGATRAPDGLNGVTGSLNWQHALPSGQISAALTRGITQTATATDQLTTALSLGYTQALTPSSTLALNLSYAVNDPGGAGASVTNRGLDATYSHALTADWNLDAGYSYRSRDAGAGLANSSAVSLTLRRAFNLRP